MTLRARCAGSWWLSFKKILDGGRGRTNPGLGDTLERATHSSVWLDQGLHSSCGHKSRLSSTLFTGGDSRESQVHRYNVPGKNHSVFEAYTFTHKRRAAYFIYGSGCSNT